MPFFSPATEAVELYHHDTWPTLSFADLAWNYSRQDAPDSPDLHAMAFQLWLIYTELYYESNILQNWKRQQLNPTKLNYLKT